MIGGEGLLRRVGVDRAACRLPLPRRRWMRQPRKSKPSSMWQTLVLAADRRKPIGARTAATSSHSASACSRVAVDQHHEVVRVTDESIDAPPARRCLSRCQSAPSASHLVAKCSSSTDRAMLASSGDRMPPCGVPVMVSRDAVLGEDASFQERLHQR